MTPSPSVSADIVGHSPFAPMWMCCTCGYAAPLNVAASPDTCSVTVASDPFSEIIRLPEAAELFSAPSWAWYDVGSAAEAMPGNASTARPTATDGAASSRDFFMLSSRRGAGDPAGVELGGGSPGVRLCPSDRMGPGGGIPW